MILTRQECCGDTCQIAELLDVARCYNRGIHKIINTYFKKRHTNLLSSYDSARKGLMHMKEITQNISLQTELLGCHLLTFTVGVSKYDTEVGRKYVLKRWLNFGTEARRMGRFPTEILLVCKLCQVENQIFCKYKIDGLLQYCSNSIANALELLPPCTTSSK